jgi:hypothetical protein
MDQPFLCTSDLDIIPVINDSISIFQLQLYTPVLETPPNIFKEINYLDARIKEIFGNNGYFFSYFKQLEDPDRIALKLYEIKDHLTAMSLTYKSIHDCLELLFLHNDSSLSLTASKYLHAMERVIHHNNPIDSDSEFGTNDNTDLTPNSKKAYCSRLKRDLRLLKLFLDGDGIDDIPIYKAGAYFYYKKENRPVNPFHIRLASYLRYKIGRRWYESINQRYF